uniref:ATPase AAA-type core domain-containing protein n=1 Tax=Gorilla gorilla gorilla TaxID=9595 RepID=A0A2I2YGT6_GORGO
IQKLEKMATVWDEAKQDGTGVEVLKMSTEEIIQRTWLLDSEIKIMKSELLRLLDVDPNDQEEDGPNIDLDSQRKDKCATYFLPVIGLMDVEKLKPGDLVGVNKDSYPILETLPRVRLAGEADPGTGGELADPTSKRGAGPQGWRRPSWPGPVGQTKVTFLKLTGPQLVQMFTGDGAKLVRDAFALAKEKAPSIIFTDELDAIGTKHFDSEKSGDQEVQRTMLELLNQLDGFQPNTQVKVIAVTNRVDILDPALSSAWARIMQIHSQKMNVSPDLACCTDDLNGAQCKAVCVEVGMIALRRGATELTHEDYMEGILEVQAKKKANLQYYA